MAKLYLIRHGQASFGTENYDRLSELGRRQAEVLGRYLRDCGLALDAAYCGSLERQKNTAEIALAQLTNKVPLEQDGRFDEVRNDDHLKYLLPAVLEQREDLRALVDTGRTDSKSYQKLLEAVFRRWVSPGFDEPRTQSWNDYSSGVAAGLADVIREQGSGKRVAVFTSGGTIATGVAHVLGLPGDAVYSFYEPLLNCSITEVLYSGERMSLSSFNDHGYLRLASLEAGSNLLSYR